MLTKTFKKHKEIKIALVGQPNVGKSMLINSISNSRLKVGNFSGVTVQKEVISFIYKEYKIIVTDLPGSYSLNDYTLEEKVTKQYLENYSYDLILNVIDSTNLQRNLYLTNELLFLGKEIIIALNMDDEAQKEGIYINEEELSKSLGVSCIKTSASKHIGITKLLESIINKFKTKEVTKKILYSEIIEKEVSHISNILKENNCTNNKSYKDTAIKLLQEDKKTWKSLKEEKNYPFFQDSLAKSFNTLYTHYNTKDMYDIFTQEKTTFAKNIVNKVTQIRKLENKDTTVLLDNILINKALGLPIFLFFMWFLFQLTFEIGSLPMEVIDSFFSTLIDTTKDILGENQLSSIIADGAIAGVGAVILFVPNIVILFLGIALLETTGYMSRVAFLLDGFFHKFGLHGKSFIPLVSGFGCSVPAYMSARTLKNDKDRLLTLFIIGFMSCGARLPIYVLFAGAFFSKEQAGNVLFIIYITGALIGLFAAKVLKVLVFKGEDEPFVMEMPKYRMPSFKLIYNTVSNKALMYLKKAGTFILAASILIWFASNYPKHLQYEENINNQISQSINIEEQKELQNQLTLYNLENSYLGYIGKLTQPFFSPLGFDWRMTIALETGLAAKEIVVSTLGILYGLGEDSDESSNGLISKIKNNISIPSAAAFIVFVMIYLPCLAASMVFAKEAGGWKYLGYLFVFTTGVAWLLAFLAFKITSLLM